MPVKGSGVSPRRARLGKFNDNGFRRQPVPVGVQIDSVGNPRARADSFMTLSKVQTVKPCRTAIAGTQAKPPVAQPFSRLMEIRRFNS